MSKVYNIQWVDKLSAEEQISFFRNYVNENKLPTDKSIATYLSQSNRSFMACICGAFNWTDTPEGHEFWDYLSDRAVKCHPIDDINSTNLKWLKKLSYRDQVIFLKRASEHGHTPICRFLLGGATYSLNTFISCSFTFSETPEGSHFWMDFREKYDKIIKTL
jgi:hypothetical protein